ncbi:HTH_48 domain-containing protein [Trichonephila clavipes]|nr:HTH_48 domain-containing protein [Trichonephila clavipes]
MPVVLRLPHHIRCLRYGERGVSQKRYSPLHEQEIVLRSESVVELSESDIFVCPISIVRTGGQMISGPNRRSYSNVAQTLKCACVPTPGIPCSSNDTICIGIVAVWYVQCYFKMFETIDQPADCEIRSVIRFLTAKNVSAAEIHRQISDVYGPNAMSSSKVRKWVRAFKDGRENVHDEPRSGRLSVIPDDLVNAVDEKIREDRR